MAESGSSTTTMVIPPALAFLVSNFQSLVTIKLDSTNYLLWKTQIRNAMRANGFFDFLDGSNRAPSPQIVDACNNRVTNPEYTKWYLIDSQLLSCLTATLSATTLPLVLGFEHAYQVWQSLESRFNSLTRTHVHEYKRRLYNITKTGTMESYIDQIKDYANRLAAAGVPVTDDDLVFHTLNGLPEEEFRGFRTAIHTRGGTFTFDELVTMLNAESISGTKMSTLESVFLATPKSVPLDSAVQTSVNMYTPSSLSTCTQVSPGASSSAVIPSLPQVTQPSQATQSTQFVPYRSQDQRNFNRNRAYDNSGRRNGCQICGRTNHSAYYCHHRQNMSLPPPSQFSSGQQGYSQGYVSSGQWRPSQGYQPQNRGQQGFQPQGHMVYSSMSPQANFVTGPAAYPSFSPEHCPVPVPPTAPLPSLPPYIGDSMFYQGPLAHQGFQPHLSPTVGTYQGSVPQAFQIGNASPSSQQWIFDSGATTHVTNDLSNLSLHQPYMGSQGLSVGNGATVPIAHSGQSNSPNPIQGSLPTGPLSSTELI